MRFCSRGSVQGRGTRGCVKKKLQLLKHRKGNTAHSLGDYKTKVYFFPHYFISETGV